MSAKKATALGPPPLLLSEITRVLRPGRKYDALLVPNAVSLYSPNWVLMRLPLRKANPQSSTLAAPVIEIAENVVGSVKVTSINPLRPQ
jgi:hypothetical protein